MAESILIGQLYLGRGLRGEELDDDVLEVSVDLPDLGVELDQAMLRYQARPYRVWLPLTTVVAGEPQLVWDDDNSLIPTQVPVPTSEDLIGFGDLADGIPTEP